MVLSLLLGLNDLVLGHGLGSDELDMWASHLQNKRGVICCDFNEAHGLDDAEWDTTVVDGKSHYRVKFQGEWLPVEPDSVVEAPNRAGRALVWIQFMEPDQKKPWVKCFLKGVEI